MSARPAGAAQPARSAATSVRCTAGSAGHVLVLPAVPCRAPPRRRRRPPRATGGAASDSPACPRAPHRGDRRPVRMTRSAIALMAPPRSRAGVDRKEKTTSCALQAGSRRMKPSVACTSSLERHGAVRDVRRRTPPPTPAVQLCKRLALRLHGNVCLDLQPACLGVLHRDRAREGQDTPLVESDSGYKNQIGHPPVGRAETRSPAHREWGMNSSRAVVPVYPARVSSARRRAEFHHPVCRRWSPRP